MIELRHFRYFLAVARHTHFTRAAQELQIAQPALSQQIAQLEALLQVQLFDRSNRRVALTDAGLALRGRAERILAEVDDTLEQLTEYAGGLRGRVVLGTNQSLSEFTLPKLLGRFHTEHPLIEIALREGMAAEMVAGLRDGSFDMAIGDLGSSEKFDDLHLEPLYQDELTIAVPPNHRFAKRERVELGELRDESFVVFKPGSALTMTLFNAARKCGFTPKVAFESADTLTVRTLVSEGLGVTLFPRIALPPGPPIRMIALDSPALTRTISLVYRNTPLGPAAAKFLAFVRECFLHQ
ncbi:MAG: LysR family transcriptional regulator [Candidatus Eremiobacteraeota bacterium]|nr:LysR family transcriptional regulator [Candidatus Eremiobacteraeota bacterium]